MEAISRDGRVAVGRVEYALVRYIQGRFEYLTVPSAAYVYDVSADGQVAVGVLGNNGFSVWRGGFGDTRAIKNDFVGGAFAVSADGRVVVGRLRRSDYQDAAVRWSEAGIELLPLPQTGDSAALGVSPDGNIVVGRYEYRRAICWIGNEPILLPDFGDGGIARGVSANGQVIVGQAYINSFWYPVRWVNGTIERLLEFPGRARRCSDDGQVIIGEYFNADHYPRAFRWHNGSWQELPTPDARRSYAYDLTADGRIIVGTINVGGDSEWRAVRWRDGVMENLNEVYANFLPPDTQLLYAIGISPDGRYIVGTAGIAGRDYDGRLQTFLSGFLLDTWRRGDVNGDGCVNQVDLLSVIFAFGTPGTGYARHEDINKDDIVNNADLLTVLFEFGNGC